MKKTILISGTRLSILRLYAQCKSRNNIIEELGLKKSTLERHRKALIKLGAMTEGDQYCQREVLVDLENVCQVFEFGQEMFQLSFKS